MRTVVALSSTHHQSESCPTLYTLPMTPMIRPNTSCKAKITLDSWSTKRKSLDQTSFGGAGASSCWHLAVALWNLESVGRKASNPMASYS